MVKKTLHTFSVEYLQILDEQGNIDQSLDENIKHCLNEDQIKSLYHLMQLTRIADQKLFNLQRSGQIGTYAQVKGQEAAQVASAYALDKEDWLVPSFRELGAFFTRGADQVKLVQIWNGDTRGFADSGKNLPAAIPIASQLIHAAGIAWACKLKKEPHAVIVYFGDGATSEGDFHEALNFAATLQLPVVFFCQNNQWAISTPRMHQTHAQTIAQKAIAYNMPSVQVDGNDALAVYYATKQALEQARSGNGPTLIEAVTYRMGDHTTSDDAHKYRTQQDEQSWQSKDPILRLEKHFQQIGTWSEDYSQWVKDTVTKEIDQAIEKALAIQAPDPLTMFDVIFANLTPDLVAQKEELKQELAGNNNTDNNNNGHNSSNNNQSSNFP